MQKPGIAHWNALRRVLRYLKGTINYGLVYHHTSDISNQNNPCNLQVYCDSDWAGDHKDRKSTTGYVIMFNGTIIGHKSSKQSGVSTSTLEAEYIALATTVTEVLWIRTLLSELGYNPTNTMIVNLDNYSAINTADNGILSNRTKHINKIGRAHV